MWRPVGHTVCIGGLRLGTESTRAHCSAYALQPASSFITHRAAGSGRLQCDAHCIGSRLPAARFLLPSSTGSSLAANRCSPQFRTAPHVSAYAACGPLPLSPLTGPQRSGSSRQGRPMHLKSKSSLRLSQPVGQVTQSKQAKTCLSWCNVDTDTNVPSRRSVSNLNLSPNGRGQLSRVVALRPLVMELASVVILVLLVHYVFILNFIFRFSLSQFVPLIILATRQWTLQF